MRPTLLIALLLCAEIGGAADMYVRDESIDSTGAYLVGKVEIAPRFLVERFGAPGPGDGIRVSGYYTFRSANGVVFSIHDYKSTTMWASDEGLPTPEAFWQSTAPVELSIGAHGNDAREFKNWLLSEYRAWLKK